MTGSSQLVTEHTLREILTSIHNELTWGRFVNVITTDSRNFIVWVRTLHTQNDNL